MRSNQHLDPQRYIPLPDVKYEVLGELTESRQRLIAYLTSLSDEESDKVIKYIEQRIGQGDMYDD